MVRTPRRPLISAFLVVHLAAVAVSNLDPGPLRARLEPWATCYLSPLGLRQGWGMFAPDPPRQTACLEAELCDAAGRRRRFAFPRMAGRPPWQAAWHYRHPKFTHRLLEGREPLLRAVAARYVVRRLGPPASAYPVEVRLAHRIWPTPPPGGPPMPARVVACGTFRFLGPAEVAP